MLSPARLGFFGIRLHTSVSLIIALDIFRAILTGTSVIMAVIHQIPVRLSLVFYLALLIIGATLGVYGLSRNSPKPLSIYALLILVRIFVSVLIAAAVFSELADSIAAMVDAFIESAKEQAKENHQPPPEIDRDAIVSRFVKAAIIATIVKQLISTGISLYSAHLIRSLVHWMRQGVGETPLLYRYVAQPMDSLVRGEGQRV
jgi:hypothetical protein